jgi:hypothetical protein
MQNVLRVVAKNCSLEVCEYCIEILRSKSLFDYIAYIKTVMELNKPKRENPSMLGTFRFGQRNNGLQSTRRKRLE